MLLLEFGNFESLNLFGFEYLPALLLIFLFLLDLFNPLLIPLFQLMLC